MSKWEYKVKIGDFEDEAKLQTWLNAEGDEGYELVSAYTKVAKTGKSMSRDADWETTTTQVLILRREKVG